MAYERLQDFEYRVVTERPFSYRLCGSCGSEFLSPRPTVPELNTFYPDNYHAYNDDHGLVARLLVGMRAKKRARFYAQLVGNRHARLFDVGTGDCRHFDALKVYCDFEFSGVELNPVVAAAGRALGYEVIDGTLEDMDLTGHDGRYDVVSMNHVLEHVIEPRKVLKKTARLLKPGGYVVGQLPCKDSWERRIFGRYWGGYHYPRHTQAFSRKGLARALSEAGFAEVQVSPTPHLQSAISLQNRLIALGWQPRMTYGKTPVYSLLLLTVAPFEALAFLTSICGVVDFQARVPARA
jgi:SAM-dependent methyltransferase